MATAVNAVEPAWSRQKSVAMEDVSKYDLVVFQVM